MADTLLANLDYHSVLPDDHDADFVQYVNQVLPTWEEPTDVYEALELFSQIIATF